METFPRAGLVINLVVAHALLAGCDSRSGLIADSEAEICLASNSFTMGSNDHYPEERPTRIATVDAFCIDTFEVTNAQFAEFVAATGYQTLAERGPSEEDYPEATAEFFKPGSAVFVMPKSVDGSIPMNWWQFKESANWRDIDGDGAADDVGANHPVVHVAYEDALAFASWRGRDLPTEAEWEYAARGEGEHTEYAWGMQRAPSGVEQANTWQGTFPLQNLATDGYVGIAPVGQFPPNRIGAYDMIGNVWEWTRSDPDFTQPDAASQRVIKGGSYLCAPNYCARYRPAARQAQEVGLGTNHVGFRTVRRN